MSKDLQDIIDNAKSALRDIADAVGAFDNFDDFNEDALRDDIHEVADGAVPVYNGELLDLAAGNNSLALSVPELGPAFDGSATPINIIAANVYEEVSNALGSFIGELETEAEEARDEAEADAEQAEADEAALDEAASAADDVAEAKDVAGRRDS